MCPHHLSMLGLVADILGFLIIAFEWRRTFKHDLARRQNVLHEAYERLQALEQGKPLKESEEVVMAKEFSTLANQEAIFRDRLFVLGAFLVLLGFSLQLVGTWPRAIAALGLKTCS
jgi:hypothetical protein